MIVYRLCRAPYAATALQGVGARLGGGRWNPVGVSMVYAASSLALSALESFVHFPSTILPLDYVSIAVDIPDAMPIETWVAADLPAKWAQTPAPDSLKDLGREWIASGRTAVLVVPSAVIPGERNVLINPTHPDAAQIVARAPEPFFFDSRLIKAPPSAPAPPPARKRKRTP